MTPNQIHPQSLRILRTGSNHMRGETHSCMGMLQRMMIPQQKNRLFIPLRLRLVMNHLISMPFGVYTQSGQACDW